MDFKTSFENYKAGCASGEERNLVETELEKYTLITEHFDAQWEQSEVVPSPSSAEISKLNKRLRHQNMMLVLTSIVLVAALLITSILGLAPSLRTTIQAWQGQTVDEKLAEQARLEAEAETAFWDPKEARFCNHVSDFQLTIDAYTELFFPGYDVASVWINKTGFASYQININRYDEQSNCDNITAAVIEGQLQLEMDLQLSKPAVNIFYAYDEPEAVDFALAEIENLPDYVDIYAAVSFFDNLSIAEVIQLQEQYDLRIEWCAVDVGDKTYGPCGMDVFSSGGIGYDLVDGSYPDFSAMHHNSNPEQLENKFKTLLKYSADRIAEGKGLPVSSYATDFYTYALDYVERNGVNIYGCFLIASPATLINLIDEGIVNGICIEDAWIGI